MYLKIGKYNRYVSNQPLLNVLGKFFDFKGIQEWVLY